MSSDVQNTDQIAIIRKIQDGDRAAQRLLYNSHVRYLAAICSRYLNNDEDVRDVLQDSFIKIFLSIKNFTPRNDGALKAWMARIVINESLRFLQKKSRLLFASISGHEDRLETYDEPQTEGIPPDVIHAAIRSLPDGYRAVFNLYVIEQRPHKEIAQLLGIKESTSASQLHKAKAMLAKTLKQYKTSNRT